MPGVECISVKLNLNRNERIKVYGIEEMGFVGSATIRNDYECNMNGCTKFQQSKEIYSSQNFAVITHTDLRIHRRNIPAVPQEKCH